jgi:hypothetical protein
MNVNAWFFGTAVLIVTIIAAAWLVDRMADRGHEIRWQERFYQPQLPARRGPVIDVQTVTPPGWETGGCERPGVPAPTVPARLRR